MEILFLIFMILAITLSSLRITAIYSSASARKWIALCVLLIAGVLTGHQLAGSGDGAIEGLFQVTDIFSIKGLPVFSNLINDVTTIAEYVYNVILFNFSVDCDGAEDLPVVMEFKDLHLTENFSQAVKTLKGSSGVYCITNQETGQMYIGSSANLGSRLTAHFLNS